MQAATWVADMADGIDSCQCRGWDLVAPSSIYCEVPCRKLFNEQLRVYPFGACASLVWLAVSKLTPRFSLSPATPLPSPYQVVC